MSNLGLKVFYYYFFFRKYTDIILIDKKDSLTTVVRSNLSVVPRSRFMRRQ